MERDSGNDFPCVLVFELNFSQPTSGDFCYFFRFIDDDKKDATISEGVEQVQYALPSRGGVYEKVSARH